MKGPGQLRRIFPSWTSTSMYQWKMTGLTERSLQKLNMIFLKELKMRRRHHLLSQYCLEVERHQHGRTQTTSHYKYPLRPIIDFGNYEMLPQKMQLAGANMRADYGDNMRKSIRRPAGLPMHARNCILRKPNGADRLHRPSLEQRARKTVSSLNSYLPLGVY